MKLVKSLLLGSAAGLATVGGAQAADLPVRKAAPVEYVRVCDAYGAGFFYIPGTDTCLRVGGLVLAQTRIQGSDQQYSIAPGATGAAVGAAPGVFNPARIAAGLVGSLPPASTFRPSYGFNRDIFGFDATARVELDARTQSPFGTVRTFVRVTSSFGSGLNATTGNLSSALGNNAFNTSAGPTVAKEITYIDKAFIQFAGLTAGRVQSFFDFYADAINYEPLRGSNQNVWAAAYTSTIGGGFSATIAVEDIQSHRGRVANVIGTGGLGIGGAFVDPGPTGALPVLGASAFTAASRVPEIVFNVRYDQPWGAAQLSAALHPIRAALYPTTAVLNGAGGALTAANTGIAGGTAVNPNFTGTFAGAGGGAVTPGYAYPFTQSNSFGFAIQGGLQFNLDSLAPGDKLWLQATYARGAIGYTSGTNMAFVGGFGGTADYGIGVARISNGYGWTNAVDVDCVFTYTGTCEKSDSFAVTAALKHFWTPTVSSGFFGSFYAVRYSNNATTPFIGPIPGLTTTSTATTGITNFKEVRLGTNLVWTPVRNFDLGAEFMYMRGITSRPFGLAQDVELKAAGLPAFQGTNNSFYGKLRAIRAF